MKSNARTHFGNSKELFMDEYNGAIYRNSITMPILQIGELAKLLSEVIKNEYPNVPWKDAIRLRDFLAHHYWRMDYGMIWDTSHENITQLKDCLSVIDLNVG